MKLIKNMTDTVRLTPLILLILLQYSCASLIEKGQYSIQYFVKNIYNDSDVVKSGSLLYEPFQVRKNKLPSLIILKIN